MDRRDLIDDDERRVVGFGGTADRQERRPGDPVDRRDDVGECQLQAGAVDAGLVGLQRGLRGPKVGLALAKPAL